MGEGRTAAAAGARPGRRRLCTEACSWLLRAGGFSWGLSSRWKVVVLWRPPTWKVRSWPWDRAAPGGCGGGGGRGWGDDPRRDRNGNCRAES